MKKILLSLAALLYAGSMWAQTDVTSTYLTNADFSSTDGWTVNQSAQYNAIGNGLIGSYQVNSGTAATIDENHSATAYCFGFQSRWSTNYSYYTQTTKELPAGYYSLTFDVQNTNSGTTSCVYDNLFSVTVGSDKYIDSDYRFKKTEWMSANTSWTTHTINFRVKSAQAVTISLGYGQAGNNYGNTATPYIYVRNLKLTQLTAKPAILAIDKTSLIKNNDFDINVSDWTSTTGAQNKARATNQTGDFRGGFYENWHPSAYTGKMYQTVTGLPTGVYELSICSFVQTYGDGETQYIYAGSAKAGLTTGTPTQYTVTNVEVTDGTLEIGFEQTVATSQWCGIDYATLTKIADPDLSAFVTSYETALSNAKTKAATTEKISATVLAALNTTITNYDEGKVDEEDADAMETATTALINATNAANTSIASYAVIASGTVSTSSLDGWTCTNSNTFHINTWSTEGNSDGSNMTTPFIENWVGKGYYLGEGTFSYTLEGLEPGEVYYAQALIRSYNEANSDAPNGPNFFINDTDIDLTEAGSTFTYNNMSGIYATLSGAATVGVDGKLTLGAKIASNANYNWVAFKNVSIQSMDNAFNAAVAKVTALEGTIPTAAYNTAYAVVTANSGANYPTTAAGFETAIAAIEAAATSASVFVAPYASFQTLKTSANALVAVENNNSDANSTLASAISAQNTAVEAATTADAITTATSTLKTAMITYVGAADPTKGNRFDCTFMITTPDLTSLWTGAWNVTPAGWATEQTGGNFQVMQNNTVDAEDGTHKVFIEYYYLNGGATWGNDKFNVYTALTLPIGTYEMSCYAFAKEEHHSSENPVPAVYFYANDTQGSLVNSSKLTEQSISFINDAEQEVKIGLKPLTGNTYNWMGIGYVELYKEYTDNTKYAINVAAITNGSATVTVDGEAASEALALKTVTVNVTPAAGYTYGTVTATYNDGEVKSLDVANPSAGVYTFQMPKYDVNVTVTTTQPSVTVTDAGFATYVSNLALDFSNTTIKAYKVKVASPGVATLTEVAQVPAKTPVLLYAAGGATEDIPVIASAAAVTDNDLVAGTGAAVATTDGDYTNMILNVVDDQVGFYFAADQTVAANRAYLHIATTLAPDAEAGAPMVIEFADEVTGIEAVEAETSASGIYNLAGQRVAKAQKGLYIVNGKKVIVK